MPANTSPIFVLTPNMGYARLNNSNGQPNTARDGSGTVVTLFTPGTNGSRVDRITITSAQATAAANSAMVARIFIYDNANSVYRLYKEVALTAVTASNTVVGSTQTINIVGGLFLKSGQTLGGTISVYGSAADQVDFITEGGDY